MNQSKYFLTLMGLVVAGVCSGELAVKNLRCEYLRDPVGIDAVQPRLSWTVAGGGRGEVQTGYRILVASSPALLRPGAADLWDTGQVRSDETGQIG